MPLCYYLIINYHSITYSWRNKFKRHCLARIRILWNAMSHLSPRPCTVTKPAKSENLTTLYAATAKVGKEYLSIPSANHMFINRQQIFNLPRSYLVIMNGPTIKTLVSSFTFLSHVNLVQCLELTTRWQIPACFQGAEISVHNLTWMWCLHNLAFHIVVIQFPSKVY